MKNQNKKLVPNYFLAGATWNGVDKTEEFIEKGIWKSGWKNNTKYSKNFDLMKVGDVIGIKRGLGSKDSGIVITAFGVVKAIENTHVSFTAYVDWKSTGMRRRVDSRGAYKTIQGPYIKGKNDTETNWINSIFCL